MKTFRLSTALMILLAAMARQAPAQQAELVGDLIPHVDTGSGPYDFSVVGGLLYFTGFDSSGRNNRECWRTDLTPEGTFVFRDFNRGDGGSGKAIPFGGKALLFAPEDGVPGLWLSDGSADPANTIKLIDNFERAGAETAMLGNIMIMGGSAAGINDWELWRTDGTVAGTYRIKDIVPGGTGSYPTIFGALNGYVLAMVSIDGLQDYQLWRTDGTEAGTTFVSEVGGNPTELGGFFYYSGEMPGSGSELWRTDATPGGTTRVRDIRPGPESSAPRELHALGSLLLFGADNGVNGVELWASDGTTVGTTLVKDINPGLAGSEPESMTTLGSIALFAARGSQGRELWSTDGTFAGTVQLRDIAAGAASSEPRDLTPLNGFVIFSADDGATGRELWISDGTGAGTTLLKDIDAGAGSSSPDNFALGAGKLWFTAMGQLWFTDGTPAGTLAAPLAVDVRELLPFEIAPFMNGVAVGALGDPINFPNEVEPWFTDGTAAGTKLIKDISQDYAGRGPAQLREHGNSVLFSLAVGGGSELWRADGAGAGVKLATIDANIQLPGSGGLGFIGRLGGMTYFQAYDAKPGATPAPVINCDTPGVVGAELWRTDGTPQGTGLFADIAPGDACESSDPGAGGGATVGTKLFFSARTDAAGAELWATNGTLAGTAMVADIAAGVNGSSPTWLTPFEGTLVFSASGAGGREPWKSDGTVAGTQKVKEINPGGSSFPQEFTELGAALIFSADDGSSGRELWRTDGTGAGTTQIADINPGAGSSDPAGFIVAAGKVFFHANDSFVGGELWITDGTPAGTLRVTDIFSGADSSQISSMAAVGSIVYFTAQDGASGFELWKSDGTSVGTVQVADLAPGSPSGYPAFITAWPGTGEILFEAWSPAVGRELWRSDGTAQGTSLFQNVAPFAASSVPSLLTVAGQNLYFAATDTFTGVELWTVDLGTPAAPPVIIEQPASQAINVGQSATFRVVATGAAPLSCDWMKNGDSLGAPDSNELMIADAVTADAGSYSCRVTAGNGQFADSIEATLTVSDPPLANLASFVGHTLPATMEAGQQLLVGVTMRNTSGVSWSKPQGYALAIISDAGAMAGGETRIELPDSPYVVPGPGGLATFVVSVTAPGVPGAQSMQVRMSDGVGGLFGQTGQLDVEIVPQVNAAGAWSEYD